jgi:hypothetical protein
MVTIYPMKLTDNVKNTLKSCPMEYRPKERIACVCTILKHASPWILLVKLSPSVIYTDNRIIMQDELRGTWIFFTGTTEEEHEKSR